MTASALQPAQTMPLAPVASSGFNDDQISLIKQTVAQGTNDLELALFLEVSKSSGLNPFQRQIYAVMRYDARTKGQKMVIQTGIDGYRLIAARSGLHMGTTDAEYGPVNADGFPEFARVIVKKLVHGHVAEFPATARWSEYVQTKDEYKNGSKTGTKLVSDMWARMPHTMLGKCAEALALRKAFPAELSGVYSDVEMAQADNAAPAQPVPAPTRTVDVTREVAQSAGVEPKTPVQEVQPAPDPVAAEWERKRSQIRQMWKECKGKGLEDDLAPLGLRYPNWRTDDDQADSLRFDLIHLSEGGKLDAVWYGEEPAPMQAEAMLTPEQRGQLHQVAKATGAHSPEQRYALWGYMPNNPTPIATNNLTAEQATYLLDTFSGMNPDERAQCLREACAKFKVAAA